MAVLPPRRRAYLRFLHRNYRRTGRWGWLLSRRIRSFGWGVIWLAAVAAVLGTDLVSSAVFMLFCTAAALLLVTFFWVFFRAAKVTGVRHLPRFGSVNVPVEYEVAVRNVGRRKLSAMLFEEWPPDPRPEFETFANTPEPGEEKRNIVDRTLLYYRWLYLQERERGFTAMEALQSPKALVRGESGKVRFELTPRHRGVIVLAELQVLLPDPVGLFQRCIQVQAAEGEVVVLPKHYPLGDFQLNGQSLLQPGDEELTNGKGETGDFTHLREYQPGDSLRSVDWKSWARTGKPIVRQYEDQLSLRFGVLLDVTTDPGPVFEEAVSTATSFAVACTRNGFPLEQMFVGEEVFALKQESPSALPYQLLEALARVQPSETARYQELELAVRQRAEGLTALLVILSQWNEAQKEFISCLKGLGIEIAVFIIHDGSEGSAAHQVQEPHHFLHIDTIALDLGEASQQLFTTVYSGKR